MSDSHKSHKTEDSPDSASAHSESSSISNIQTQADLIQLIHDFEVEIHRVDKRAEQQFDSSLKKVNADFLRHHIHLQKEFLATHSDLKNLTKTYNTSVSEVHKLRRKVASIEMAYKLPDSTPTFSGKSNENVAEWLYIVNTSLLNAGVDMADAAAEQKRVRFLTPFLKGIALQYVMQKQSVAATVTAGGYKYSTLQTDFFSYVSAN
jgi:hypothetical protein